MLQQLMDAITSHSIIFQAIIFFLFIWLITRWLRTPARVHNSPPSPAKLPLLGNLHQLSLLPQQDLQSLAMQHGPIMLLHLGRVPTLVVSSAAGARAILKTHDLDFADRPEARITKKLLYGQRDVSFAPYGEYWRQLKSICVLQLLNTKRVQAFRHVREEQAAVLMNKIRQARPAADLCQMFGELTNNIVCRAAFGKTYSEGEIGKKYLSLLREFFDLLGIIDVGDFVPWLSWISRVKGIDARVDKVAKGMDEFLEGVIEERMRSTPEENGGHKDENFADILVDIYRNKASDITIDRDSVKAIILDMFAAGTDTTSTVLEWSMSELLRHPEIMKRLQYEVRGVMECRHDILDEDLERMHYLKVVIKETLRLHTPIPLLVARVARKDVNVLGYDVSAGTMVMINAWAISRDPTTWDEPEKFNPDRFLGSTIDFKGMDFELIPFGAGRRGCPGIAFAMATTELVLANLVHKFDWTLPEEGKELDMGVRPGPVLHRAVPLLAVANEHHYC